MTDPDSSPPEPDHAPAASSPPPKSVSIQDQEDHRVLRYRDPSLGLRLLGLPLMYVVTVAGHAISVGGYPASEVIAATVIGALVLLFPVAMILNATTITVGDRELVVTRGPLSLSRTRRLRVDEIENLHVKGESGQQSGNLSFQLRAALEGVEKPLVLARLWRDHEVGYYLGNAIYERLGWPGEVGFVGTGNRRGPPRPRPF